MLFEKEKSLKIWRERKTKEYEKEEVKSDGTLTAGLCLALACPLVVVLKKTK